MSKEKTATDSTKKRRIAVPTDAMIYAQKVSRKWNKDNPTKRVTRLQVIAILIMKGYAHGSINFKNLDTAGQPKSIIELDEDFLEDIKLKRMQLSAEGNDIKRTEDMIIQYLEYAVNNQL